MLSRIVGLITLTMALASPGLAQDAPASDGLLVTLVDERSEESKQYYHESTFSAIAILGDKALKEPPIPRLQTALSKKATQPMSVVATELRFMDFYPVRLKAGGGGGLLGNSIMKGLVNSKTDWSFIQNLNIPKDTDAIICLFAGTVNGKEVKTATFAPYKTSAWTLRVDTSKPYLAAFESVYQQTAEKIVEQAGSAAAQP